MLETRGKKLIGQPFPTFAASDGKSTITNENLQGKVVLINFWFEGCGPCMAEFDALNELQGKLKDRKDFEFISFSFDNAETIKSVKDKYGLRFKVLQVTDPECRRLNFNNGFPTTIILDKTGKLRYIISSGTTDQEKARKFVMTTLLSKIMSEL